jgi:hypothetical protein
MSNVLTFQKSPFSQLRERVEKLRPSSLGEGGGAITDLQAVLVLCGFLSSSAASGRFDNTTLEAVKKMQRAIGSEASGILNGKTTEELVGDMRKGEAASKLYQAMASHGPKASAPPPPAARQPPMAPKARAALAEPPGPASAGIIGDNSQLGYEDTWNILSLLGFAPGGAPQPADPRQQQQLAGAVKAFATANNLPVASNGLAYPTLFTALRIAAARKLNTALDNLKGGGVVGVQPVQQSSGWAWWQWGLLLLAVAGAVTLFSSGEPRGPALSADLGLDQAPRRRAPPAPPRRRKPSKK